MALKDRKNADIASTTTTSQEASVVTEKIVETPVKETAVAVATEKSVALPTKVLTNSAFITNPGILEAVCDAEYGDYPSVVASNGSHLSGEDDLGKTIEFQAVTANNVWKISTGSTDSEAKEFFKVSYDGAEELEDTLQEAKEAGFNKSAIKKYVEVIALIKSCENADFVGEYVILGLSPSSQYTWRPLAKKCKMRAAMGRLVAEPIDAEMPDLGSAVIFKSVATPAKWEGNNFTKFEFSIK